MSINEIKKHVTKIEDMNINKNYNTHCNNYYALLSKFGKNLTKNFDEDTFLQFPLYKYDKKALLNVC